MGIIFVEIQNIQSNNRNLLVDNLSLFFENQQVSKSQINTNVLCLKPFNYVFLTLLVKHEDTWIIETLKLFSKDGVYF